MAVRLGHINAHNHPDTVRKAARWNAHSLGLDEVGKIPPETFKEIERERGYLGFTLDGTARPDRGSRSTRLLVRDDLTVIGGVNLLMAAQSTPDRIAPPRWIQGQCYETRGKKVAHLEFHNHAVVDGRPVTVDRVAEHERALKRLRSTLIWVTNTGHAGFLTGDLNTRDEAKSIGWTDAGEMFRALGWDFKDLGLDWVAWNPGTSSGPDLERFTREEMGTDHASFVAEFDLK